MSELAFYTSKHTISLFTIFPMQLISQYSLLLYVQTVSLLRSDMKDDINTYGCNVNDQTHITAD